MPNDERAAPVKPRLLENIDTVLKRYSCFDVSEPSGLAESSLCIRKNTPDEASFQPSAQRTQRQAEPLPGGVQGRMNRCLEGDEHRQGGGSSKLERLLVQALLGLDFMVGTVVRMLSFAHPSGCDENLRRGPNGETRPNDERAAL